MLEAFGFVLTLFSRLEKAKQLGLETSVSRPGRFLSSIFDPNACLVSKLPLELSYYLVQNANCCSSDTDRLNGRILKVSLVAID